MEKIANNGNGNYNYIDNILEAKKVLVNEFSGTVYTIAKDVKLQLEFNPAKVESYRLIGYENRKLENQDFADDTKDAGELGAGHTVVALYEIVRADGAEGDNVFKYQQRSLTDSDELLTVKFRYKDPDGSESKLIEHVVKDGPGQRKNSNNFRFAAAVAQFGLVLMDSEHKSNGSLSKAIKLAEGAIGEDTNGYRKDFIQLAKETQRLMKLYQDYLKRKE